MSVDARHAVTVGLLTASLAQQRIDSLELAYKHGTPVDIPRNKLFASALERKFDILVWMDSDCYVRPRDIEMLSSSIMESYFDDISFTTFATEQRNGLVNIWKGDDAPHYQNRMSINDVHRLAQHRVGMYTRKPIVASGLGLAIFSMRQFRRQWPKGPWFTCRYAQTDEGECFQSEDFVFTSTLERRIGRKPTLDPRIIVRHVHRGGA